jgi:hypothetical protein
MTKLKILPQYLFKATEKNHEISYRSRASDQDMNRDIQNLECEQLDNVFLSLNDFWVYILNDSLLGLSPYSNVIRTDFGDQTICMSI